jgi:hypothetical protein
MQRFGAFYRDFAHALLAFCANLGRKAIKSTILVAKPLESGECRFKPVFVRLTVVSRRHFFFVAPDWRHVTGTMMAALGGLRGFVGERR